MILKLNVPSRSFSCTRQAAGWPKINRFLIRTQILLGALVQTSPVTFPKRIFRRSLLEIERPLKFQESSGIYILRVLFI